MQQKKSLKPTLILALDPFAAAFCAEVRARLEGVFGARETLIQARAVVPRDAGLSFTADPAEAGDTAFDLEASRARLASHSVRQVEELFEGCQEAAEEELSELLGAGRSLGDIEAAKRSGFEVVNTRLIYLVLSSVDPFAVGAVLETARLIRWLFATRYADELHTLHALVLLPDLFGNHTAPDHATTYSLFKKLDYAFTNGVRIVHRQNLPPFESCWLMDGRNQRAVGTGTLAENLAGYADAFVGLLSANPEDSMATPGMYARGKPPAYNSFGYGELYFPSAAAVARLSAALAHDITRRTYLGEGTGERHSDRQHLTAVTRFIRSQEYAHALQQVERHQGTAIWRDFSPREEPREAAPGEYVAALRLRHEEFEREQQLEFREALLLSGGRARDDLVARFDEEIDRRADASPAGLGEAVEYLRVMVARAVELQGHLIGEEPQNLWTALRAVKADLDERLGLTVDRERSRSLLKQIQVVRNRLDALRTDLRLLPEHERPDGEAHVGAPAGGFSPEPPAAEASPGPEAGAPPTEDAPSDPPRQHSPAPEAPRERLSREIEEAEQRLRDFTDEYGRAAEAEDMAANALRHETRGRMLEEKKGRIEEAETEFLATGEQLRIARRDHEDRLEEKRQFLRQHLIVRPSLTLLTIFGLPLVAALGDVGPARELVAFVWDSLQEFTLVLLLITIVYLLLVLWVFTRRLQPRIADARERVTQLSSHFAAAGARLRRARNDLHSFVYQLTAQRERVETVTHLIQTAQLRIQELTDRLAALRELAVEFARARDEAEPLASPMRRPLLLADDIDAYYRETLTDVEAEGESFARLHELPRSRVRRVTAEEFRSQISSFAREKFKHLEALSITDAMFHRPDLIKRWTVELRLRELHDAAEPLLRLRQTDAAGTGRFAQRDATLWVSAEERVRLQDAYGRISPGVTVRVGDDEGALRVLTRCLNFPAYSIGSVEFYRERYARSADKAAAELPDVMPSDERVKRAHERFLLALAMGVVERRPAGDYVLAGGNGESFGHDRPQIAERLSGSLVAQKLYDELEARLERTLRGSQSVYQKLQEFLESATDLAPSERELLTLLAQKYF